MRKFWLSITLFSLSVFLINSNVFSQSNDSLKAQLIKDWQRAKEYTKLYLDKMPANKYDYRPVDSIRSFAEQMLHLAQGNVGLMSNGIGKPPLFMGRNLEKTKSATTKDSVVYFVMSSYDYCIEGLQSMDASKMDEHMKRGPFDITRRAWIMKAFEHQTHHRGQCTIYIRLQGITPPNEMLF